MDVTEPNMPSLVQAVAKFVLRRFRSVTITYPSNGASLPAGVIELQGTSRLRLNGNFVACHRDGNQYWPHGKVIFHARDNSWKAQFKIDESYPKQNFDIVIVEIGDLGDAFVDFYYKHGEATKWAPIEVSRVTQGFVLFDEIRICRQG